MFDKIWESIWNAITGHHFRNLNEIFGIKKADCDRIDKQISTLIYNASDMGQLCKEADKLANNEEELKFIWFRLGQIEMGNMLIKHLKTVFDTVLEDIRDIIASRTGVKR